MYSCVKIEKFLRKILIILVLPKFVGTRRGSTKEYPQSMFWIKIRQVYPCLPQFYFIKVEFKGYLLHEHVILMFYSFAGGPRGRVFPKLFQLRVSCCMAL